MTMEGVEPSPPRIVQIRIEVHADVLCPWSYMQKRALEIAIQRYAQEQPAVAFDVSWKPYYIHAMLDCAGVEKPALYQSSLRSRDRWDRLTLAGTKYGIRFQCTGTTGSSRDAHKLIHIAQGGPAQTQVVGDLFLGHFEQGRDVLDKEWLLQVGVAAGIRADVAAAAIESEGYGHMIDEAVRTTMREGDVTAVPTVMMQAVPTGKRYALGGFQEAVKLMELFCRIHAEESAVTLPPYQELVNSMPAGGQYSAAG